MGILALDYQGRIGSCGVQKGFTYAVGNNRGNKLKEAKAVLNKKATIGLAMKVK